MTGTDTASPVGEQTSAASQTDRYISFCGIDCDGNANRLMAVLEQHIAAGNGQLQWREYFVSKRAEQARMKHDNLYFIGAQMNNLYSYLEDCADDRALQLLWDLEQECC